MGRLKVIPTLAQDDALLAHVLPELATRYKNLRALAQGRGVTVRLAPWDGAALRTEADTTKHLRIRDTEYALYVAAQKKAGKTPLPIGKWRPIAPYGKSYHNYGAAVDTDVYEWPEGKTQQWGRDLLDTLAPSVGLRSGDAFDDEPHFELPYSLETVKAKYAAVRGSLQPAPHAAAPANAGQSQRAPVTNPAPGGQPVSVASRAGGGSAGGSGAPHAP